VKRVQLQAVKHRNEYTEGLEPPINSFFQEVLFKPLRDSLTPLSTDKPTSVAAALAAGTLAYSADTGRFYGTLNAEVSKELRAMGATYSSKGFYLPSWKIPLALKSPIHLADERNKGEHAAAIALLSLIARNAVRVPSTGIQEELDPLLGELRSRLDGETSRTLPENLPLPSWANSPQVTADLLRLAEEDVTAELVFLATTLADKLEESDRIDTLHKLIEVQEEQARRAAKTLAERQAALFIAKYRQDIYTSIGLPTYVWNTQKDARVRHDHSLLENTTQSWDSPPIVDSRTGFRAHPGQSSNCRCYPTPVWLTQ